jgi:riboflavin kinase/FMN adenylyltransferase
MKIIKGDISQINEINGLEKSVVVIGNFDGVHKYHQKLFKMAQEIADQDNLSLVIITFDQSFEDYFHQTNQKIFSNEEKIDLIKNNFEIDYYIELKVNKNITQYNKMMFMT